MREIEIVKKVSLSTLRSEEEIATFVFHVQ